MPDISTILILTHFNPDLQRYFVGLVAKEWEARGIRVLVHRDDLHCSVSADVCFVHVDLSVVPPHYIEFASQYPNTINLHITDIRKTSYSRNRVIRGDGYDGPIIREVLAQLCGSTRTAGTRPSITSKSHYRIFPNRRMLPVGWLDRGDIVVERFRPERHGDNFVLREWYFLGDREYYSCEISRDPIFTSATKCPGGATARCHKASARGFKHRLWKN
jgi:hypothetical protein